MKNFLALVLALSLLAGCNNSESSGPPIVRSASEYDRLLEQAAELSREGLKNYEEGLPHTEQNLKDLRRAAEIFEGLADNRPTNYANFMALGKIARALGDQDGAMKNFQQAVQLRPREPRPEDLPALAECSAEVARMLFEHEQLQGAFESINDAIADAPEDPRHYAMLGHILIQQRDIAGAQKALDHALTLDPENSEAQGLKELIRQAAADQKPQGPPR